MSGVCTGLRSLTRVLDRTVDPLTALGPGGFAWFAEGLGLATAGVAARVSAADAADVLAAIGGDDRLDVPGTGPLAVGPLGFDGTGTLVIPARIAGRTALDDEALGGAEARKVDHGTAVLHDLDVTSVALLEDAPVRLAMLRAGTGLKMPDCCVLLAAEQTHGALATFDDRLATAATKRGLAVRAS